MCSIGRVGSREVDRSMLNLMVLLRSTRWSKVLLEMKSVMGMANGFAGDEFALVVDDDDHLVRVGSFESGRGPGSGSISCAREFISSIVSAVHSQSADSAANQ